MQFIEQDIKHWPISRTGYRFEYKFYLKQEKLVFQKGTGMSLT